MMAASSRRELYKLRELVHFLLSGAGETPRDVVSGELWCTFCLQPLNAYAEDFKSHGNSVGPKLDARLTIHHLDGNHSNNDRENKGLCHTSCHKSHHRTIANKLRSAAKAQGGVQPCTTK